MLGRRYDVARLQSDFYRDQFRKILRWLLVAVFVMYILIGCIVYQMVKIRGPQYFANTTEGKILSMP